MTPPVFYSSFQAKANQVKNDFLSFLIEVTLPVKSVVLISPMQFEKNCTDTWRWQQQNPRGLDGA